MSTCTWWWDNPDGAIACKDMPFEWGISMEDFLLWNPSITADCGNFLTGRSYCVEAPAGGTQPPPTTTTTTGPAPTSGNGIETPLPTRPGMTSDCDEFYYVEVGDTCPGITAAHDITTAQFIKWNPSVGSDCTGLWASYYMCVSVIGQAPGTTTKTSSTPPGPTTPPNGIETPLPIQPGMVDNCDAFHMVQQGDTCDTIAAKYKISTTQFVTWNPSVGSSCGGMWANTYVCVSIIGHNPNPTTTTTTTAPPTTTTGSGPSPTQSGLVKTCTSFYKAPAGDTCETIAQQKFPYINSLVLFKRWNPAVGEDCSDLRPGYHYCVATELHQPMPGIIDTCKRYYQVKDGDSCWSIQQKYGITSAQFNRWNPLVGSSCASLWVNFFVCIGV